MDDIIGPLLIILGIAGVGWFLGILGFIRANRAIRQITQLRLMLAERTQGVPQPAEPQQAAPPQTPIEPAIWTLPEPIEAIETAPEPVPDAVPPPVPARRRDWEELLTAKWGVWLGAAALLLSGVFLVRYAADEGLLGPEVRCAAAVLLGLTLIAGSEWLRKRSAGPANLPDYAPGALAAGGVAVLYAAAYLAGPLYGMVGNTVAFVLLAAASLAGLGLSLRLGQLVAAVGLVGAFVTPLLVQSDDPSLPGLFGYLMFVAAAALAVVRYTAWVWLGWATTIACAGFVLAVTLSVGDTATELWAPALFVPGVALLALLLLPGAALDHPVGRALAYVPLAALGLAGLLLSIVSPYAIPHAGVLLVVAITLAKGGTEARLDRLPWLGAALFLLLITGWGLPPWHPAGEAITAGDTIIATLPGRWVPDALAPLLWTALVAGAVFVAAGLWGERRRPNPLRWAALAATVPVLSVAILYARIAAFQPDDLWAGLAVAVAALGTAAAAAAARDGSVSRAGVHAAGATAALALACGAVFNAQWLTVALALFLPALAAIENRASLPPLRWVGLAVAVLAIIRLLFNPFILDEAAGKPPILDGLIPAYGVAALAFFATARMLRRRADDLVVAVLELAGAAFVAALTLLEVRQWSTGRLPATAETSFIEIAMDVGALALLSLFAWHLHIRASRPMLGGAAQTGGCVAMAGGVGLIVANPAFVSDWDAGPGMLINGLLPAYAIPAVAAAFALRMPGLAGPPRRALLAYALVAAFAYVTLAVRHVFAPYDMALSDTPVSDAELWAWSGAWLGFGLVLMGIGIATAMKVLRLTALAIVALAGAKVFLFDMAGLAGLWRVLSFLGLGLTLIGLGAVYRRFVASPALPPATLGDAGP
jgi:uncharacterized membrane protein